MLLLLRGSPPGRRGLLWRLLLSSCLAAWMLLAVGPARAEEGRQGRLVTPAWLQRHLGEVLVLDASFTPQHQAGHIPGAVSADLYRYGPALPTTAQMEQRLQSWGVSSGRKIVVYDKGGDMMAPRLFYDLYYHGVPAEDIHLLDGGFTRWQAAGGAVTKEPTPTPAPGNIRVTQVRAEQRTRLPEFLAASGDRTGHVLVEALEPAYHYGAQKFFDRPGHVPGAVLMPGEDFFNADKTMKSPEEMRRMLRYLGVQPGQVLHSHCGGGVAAAVPWFALQFVAERPQVRLYLESQREWLRDERSLPFWTYAAPHLLRDSAWLSGWNGAMLRMYGAAELNLVDVRPAERYALGHIPFALNIPAETFRRHLGQPEALAALLGPAGVNPSHELVLVAEQGLTPDAALAFLALAQAGHPKLSVLLDTHDDWALRGHELTKEPTRVGPRRGMKDLAVPAASYPARPRDGVVVSGPLKPRGEYPPVVLALGRQAPAPALAGDAKLLHLPYTELLEADGKPKAAGALWQQFQKAGVPRYGELLLVADDPAEAAVGYVVFRLMGWPDVKVWLRS